jgi:hypothetical protein
MKNAPAWVPGQGEADKTTDSPNTAPDLQHQDNIDHRLAPLACAAARDHFDLVEHSRKRRRDVGHPDGVSLNPAPLLEQRSIGSLQ